MLMSYASQGTEAGAVNYISFQRRQSIAMPRGIMIELFVFKSTLLFWLPGFL